MGLCGFSCFGRRFRASLLLPALFSWLLRWAGRNQFYRTAALLSRLTDLLLLRRPEGTSETYRALARIQAGKGEEVIREFRERLEKARDFQEKALLARQILPLLAKAGRFQEVVDLFQAPYPWAPRTWEPLAALLVRSLAELGRWKEAAQVAAELEEGPAGKDLQARGWMDMARMILLAGLGEAETLEALLAPTSSFAEEVPRGLVREWLEKARRLREAPPLTKEDLPPGLYETLLERARQSAALPRSLGLGPEIAPVTTLLCLGILGFYVWSEILGGATDSWALVKLGALFSREDLLVHPWKLFTTMFLHFGPVHMGVNLLALWLFGRLAEQAFGKSRYLLIYMVSGAAGGVLSLLFGQPGIRVGASGAILGVIGAATMLFSTGRSGRPWPPAWRKQVFLGLFITLAGTVAFGFFFEAVDNLAHLGGALAGMILASLPGGAPGKAPSRSRAVSWGRTLFLGGALLLFGALPFLAARYDPFQGPWPEETALGLVMEVPPWWGEFPLEDRKEEVLQLGVPGTCVLEIRLEEKPGLESLLPPPREEDSLFPPSWRGGRIPRPGAPPDQVSFAFARRLGGKTVQVEFLVKEKFLPRETRALARLLASLRPEGGSNR